MTLVAYVVMWEVCGKPELWWRTWSLVATSPTTSTATHIAPVRTQHALVTGTSTYARKSWGGHPRCDLAPLTTSFGTVGQWERQHLAMAGSEHLHLPRNATARRAVRSTLHTLPLGVIGARCALDVDRAYTQWLQHTQAGARVLLRALDTLAGFQEPWFPGSTHDVSVGDYSVSFVTMCLQVSPVSQVCRRRRQEETRHSGWGSLCSSRRNVWLQAS